MEGIDSRWTFVRSFQARVLELVYDTLIYR
jgi:hypothetical protein